MDRRRRSSDYVDLVVSTGPRYYWPMQETPNGSSSDRCFIPAVGTKLLRVERGGWAAPSAPFPGAVACGGSDSTATALGVSTEFRCYETAGDGFNQTVNANENSTGYSYMLWAKQRTVDTSNSALLGNWNGSGSMIHIQNSGAYLAYHNGSSFSCGTPDTLWHHWCVTWDGATQKVYKDGAQVASNAVTGALGSSAVLRVGSYSGGNVANIDACHAAWWVNRCLDPGTVKALARVG